jgi:hypothetical protein
MRLTPWILLLLAGCASAPAGDALPAGQSPWARFDDAVQDGAPVPGQGQYRVDVLLLRGPADAPSPFLRPEAWRAVSAPRLVVLAGREASITLTSAQAYVADFTEVRREELVLADPEVGELHTGFRLDAVVREGGDGALRADLRFHRSELERMVVQDIALDAGTGRIQVQLPALAQVDAAARLDGTDALVGLFQLPLLPGDDEVELAAVRVYPAGAWPPATAVARQRLRPRQTIDEAWPPAG